MAKLSQGPSISSYGSGIPSPLSKSPSALSKAPISTPNEQIISHSKARIDARQISATDTARPYNLPTQRPSTPLAVIGWSHKFPGDAATSDGFWNMLCDGRTAHGRIPKDRFDVDAFYHPTHKIPGTINVTSGHFLSQDISAFDAPFFGIQPKEAAAMDPQQRLMLETSYHAFENAGLKTDALIGSNTSVHIGAFSHDYEVMHARDPESEPPYLATGIGGSMLANRISWFFDLRGESMLVDTACSSSLSCLHLATRALQTGDSDIALVGGANIMITPDSSFFHHSAMGFFSPDGRSYSFDERANGYAKGEGTAVVILKRLDDAIRDGDTVRAVVGATGTNQDGRTPGITQPSAEAQKANMRTVHERYGIDPNEIHYLEAHGTGTQLGDPVECAAIAETFQRSARNPLIVGTVKPNIGHLEAVAGLAGLIKAIMALEKGLIPPIALYQTPNPRIDAEKWNLIFPKEVTPWPVQGPRTAAVSSFGYGGSNVYVILHDALHFLERNSLVYRHNTVRYHTNEPDFEPGPKDLQASDCMALRPRIFLWSGADESSVYSTMELYRAHLNSLKLRTREEQANYLRDLSFTLSNRRTALPWKAFVVAESMETLIQGLDQKSSISIRSSRPPTLIFVFTGQGAQWFAMGRELIYHPRFSESLERAERILRLLGHEISPREELLKDKTRSRIDEPLMSQTLCTILQLALVDLLVYEDIMPAAVIGHSSGEIAAAYCAGGLSFESAVRAAFYRGYYSSHLAARTNNDHGMIAVQLSADQVQPYIDNAKSSCGGELTIACENCPNLVTLAGDINCIEQISKVMEQEGIFARQLRVPLAYHSPQMYAISEPYYKSLQGIRPSDSVRTGKDLFRPAMFSTVTGKQIYKASLADPNYWVENMNSTVKFSLGFQNLINFLESNRSDSTTSSRFHVLEIGPSATLKKIISNIVAEISQTSNVSYDSVLERNVSAVQSILQAIGSLRCSGMNIDLERVNSSVDGSADAKQIVDLPSYSFNHSQQYWAESRLNKNLRTRSIARHTLLGVPNMDWNPLAPSWDHRLTVTENPWIMDHRIDSSHIYPAAGMISMVIEAARQLTARWTGVSGYHLTRLRIIQALKVNDSSEGTEVKLNFHRPRDVVGPSNEHDFTLFTYVDQSWIQCFSGTITVEFVESKGEISRCQFTSRRMIENLIQHKFHPPYCSEPIVEAEFYQNLAQYGYEYGPTHQTVQSVYYSKQSREACGHVVLDSWIAKSKAVSHHTESCVIHPTELDGILQLTLAAFSRAATQALPVMLPTRCESLWFSNELLERRPGTKLHAFARNTFTGLREADYNVVAVDEHHNPVVVMEGWREMAVTTLDTLQPSHREDSRLCYTTLWDLDIEHMSSSETQSTCETRLQKFPQNIFDADVLEFLSMYYVSTVVQLAKSDCELTGFGAHTQQYVDWANRTHDQHRLEQLMDAISISQEDMTDEHKRDAILDRLALQSPECQLTVHVGRHIERLLRGELDPLEVVYGQAYIRDFYKGPIIQRNYDQVKSYLSLLAHKNPNLKIVEIGAGTGSGTTGILPALTTSTGDVDRIPLPRFRSYDFTDVSPQFFEHAKPLLAKYGEQFNFVTLNIEEDPVKQGFEAGTYDVVFASLVLHATSDIAKCLKNVRKLLKPGGKLILIELTSPDCARVHFIFGLLPGWWLSTEEIRAFTPVITSSQWDTLLKDNGFAGSDLSMPDNDNLEKATSHMITATATEVAVRPNLTVESPLIVINDESNMQQDVARGILSILELKDNGNVINLSEITGSVCCKRNCIVIAELDRSLLGNITEPNFSRLKSLFGAASNIVWATSGAGDTVAHPERGLVTGLGRSVRSENPTTSFTHLAFDEDNTVADIVRCVCSAHTKSITLPIELREDVYHISSGRFSIGRVYESDKLNSLVLSKTAGGEPQRTTIKEQKGRRLALSIGTAGLLNTLHFADDTSVSTSLGDFDVEVLPSAVGLNFRDVLTAIGKLASKNFGLEFAGTVSRAGNKTDFQPGDRVLGMTPNGAFRTHVHAPAASVVKMNDSLSFEEAAAVPMAWSTAYYSLVTKANLQSDESVLIHSGAGGVGQAAIQIARHIGATIFVTVGNEDKKQFIMDKFDIPASRIFSSRTTKFVDSIMQMTNGNGVDVVLNSLTGSLMRASWSIIAPLGRFIEIGKTDIMSDRGLQTHEFLNSVSFISVDLLVLMRKAPKVVQRVLNSAMNFYNLSSPSSPWVPQLFNAGEIEKAFRWMQGGSNIGKAVVTFRPETHILATPNREAAYKFPSDCTYLIAGGFGGVGGAILKWMVSRGARHFLVPSRSGQGSSKAQQLLTEVARDDVMISGPCCDISNYEEVKDMIEQARRTMPPIKGCIQATAVLGDAFLANMTYETWNIPIRPKVLGTWNLHEHLPNGMDFFLTLSSVASIVGSRGQANYAAGNAYEDTLVRYRQSLGERACTINIGPVKSVGKVVEMGYEKDLLKDGFEGIEIDDLLTLIEYVCNPEHSHLNQRGGGTQIITGLGGVHKTGAKQKEDIYWLNRPFTSCLNNNYTNPFHDTGSGDTDKALEETSTLLRQHAKSDAAAVGVVLHALQVKLSRSLNISLDDVEASLPIHAFGVDSLVSMEVRYWFLKEIKTDLAVFEIMSASNLKSLCEAAWHKSTYREEGHSSLPAES